MNLSEDENIVLDVVLEYLDKNRTFNMQNILPFINIRFKMASININNKGIEEILKSLVKKKLIREGSKLNRGEILFNKKRNIIYHFLKGNPGTYFNQIVNGVKMSNHIITWHLKMLVEFNYIDKANLENHIIFFDSNLNLIDAKRAYYMRNERVKSILDYLEENNTGLTRSYLSKNLKMHLNTITKYINIIEDLGLIYKEKLSNQILYFKK